MHRFRLLILAPAILFFACGRTDTLAPPEAYFSAIIVADLDQSVSWYTNTLAFKLIDSTANASIGSRQANLELDHALLELIELQSAVSLSEAIPDYQQNTRTIGLFKMGFQLAEFDRWLEHFNNQNVRFRGDVVTDKHSGKRMVILLDPDGNRVQLFEK